MSPRRNSDGPLEKSAGVSGSSSTLPRRAPTDQRSPYERIRDAISDGVFEAGTPLVESSLAEWCGVSRTPIREALSRLQHDGLVIRTDRGVVVRERSPEEILDIYETRISLEMVAARLAAQRHTSIDRVRLTRNLELYEQTGRQIDRRAERNREFHGAIWHASHNESLADLLDRLNLHLLRYPQTTLAAPGRWEETLDEHRALVEAILARDAEAAQEAAYQHFARARDLRLKVWEQQIK